MVHKHSKSSRSTYEKLKQEREKALNTQVKNRNKNTKQAQKKLTKTTHTKTAKE